MIREAMKQGFMGFSPHPSSPLRFYLSLFNQKVKLFDNRAVSIMSYAVKKFLTTDRFHKILFTLLCNPCAFASVVGF